MKADDTTKIYDLIFQVQTEMRSRFEWIVENMATKSDFDKAYTILDRLVGQSDTDEIERLAQSAQLSRHDDKLARLDRRVSKLEGGATA